MFGLHFHPRPPALRPRRLAGVQVVAREVPAAPSGWIFFDGSETRVCGEDGAEFIVPGGAFFVSEARLFASTQDAEDAAARLNRADPWLDRPWQAFAASAFLRGAGVAQERHLPKARA